MTLEAGTTREWYEKVSDERGGDVIGMTCTLDGLNRYDGRDCGGVRANGCRC